MRVLKAVFLGVLETMPARLLHIWGPLWIQSYGIMILLALLVSLPWAVYELERRKLLSRDVFLNGLSGSVFFGILGGRFMYFFFSPAEFWENPFSFFAVWDGGLSLLGALLAIPLFAILFLMRHQAPVFPVADVIMRYVPLVQAIARLGCFFAGCCYGLPAEGFWGAVTYHDVDSLAPCGVALHPAQLYAAAASLIIFMILLVIKLSGKARTPGIMFGLYFFFEGIARCVVEFWRADYLVDSYFLGFLTSYQVLSLGIAFVGGLFAFERSFKYGK